MKIKVNICRVISLENQKYRNYNETTLNPERVSELKT